MAHWCAKGPLTLALCCSTARVSGEQPSPQAPRAPSLAASKGQAMPLTTRRELPTLDASTLQTRAMAQATVRQWMLKAWSTLSSCTTLSRMMQHTLERFL